MRPSPVRIAADPMTISLVWHDAETCFVGLRQNRPTRLSGPQIRFAIGLLLESWNLPLGVTAWTRTATGHEVAGLADEFIGPARRYAENIGKAKAAKLLKEHKK